MNLYSNLSKSYKTKKEANAKERAKYLASLPKNPFKRFLYRLKPSVFFPYWFSKRGLKMMAKIIVIGFIALCILVGLLFAFFRKDLSKISTGELASNVQTTVNTYLDRNGKVLWEDKGTGNYKLVVAEDKLSDYLKQATVSIEDKNFYTEGGISISGIMRAAINNVFGGSTQGGSTLTQQLVKQVFFDDEEASKRGINGIPRKIKEMILAIEVERMYDKDQILALYLNESPYGGRRNGAESAAQTYFGVTADELTLAQAALLAAIPQNPSYYNPYNIEGNEDLIARQHTVLDKMAEEKYITKEEAEEAKEYPILDSIIPEADQYSDIKAPHFVQMVREQLIEELGDTVVGKGGLTITTTLDIRIQEKLEEAVDTMFASSTPAYAGFSNGAATVEDSQTGQIVALVGSRDYNYAGYGQDNATVASIQPGSTIKPLVYTQLFENKGTENTNYGSGSILNDVNIDSIYGAKLYNADHKFKGPMTIRTALATSRNVPAVTAMYVSGVKDTLATIHELGATSYCTEGDEVNAGLSSAIGGCGVRQIDLVNAFASVARGGAYKPQATILEVKDSNKKSLIKWSDVASEQVIDAQSAYIISDILSDDNARSTLAGYHAKGMYIEGVKTATKTGTSDKEGNAKDIWMVSYSPALTMAVWLGNSDATILSNGNSLIPGSIVDTVMSYAHKEVYASEGKWKTGDWFTQPDGIQKIGSEVYPSWWSKNQGQTNSKLTFDLVSKKKATDATPSAAKIELDVTKSIDPITKKPIYTNVPAGYDATADDDVHKSTDVKPSASITWTKVNATTYTVSVNVTKGTFAISGVQLTVDGAIVSTTGSGPYTYTYTVKSADAGKTITASALVTDAGMYTTSPTGSQSF